MLLLKFKVTWSVSLMHWSVVLWRARKPKWLAWSRSLSSRCLWTNFRITFSNSLSAVDKRLIGRKKIWGNLGSLPGFGKVIASASFQDTGKSDSRMQWLNRWVRCTSGLLGRCLRHSFGMPSIPQAFFSFSVFTIFCTSHGLTLSGGLLSTASSRAWTLASSRRSWFSPHKSWGVNRSSKQSAIALASSVEWNLRPEEPRIAVGALAPSLLMTFCNRPDCLGCDLAVPYSCFPPFKFLFPSHSPDAFSDPVNCRTACWFLGFMP
jgi:hypothetical protein